MTNQSSHGSPENGGGTPAAPAPRPSDARRQALNRDLGTPSISSFFPIARYYDLAQKLYRNVWKEVHNAEKRDLDAMYVYAKRYCLFLVDVLPRHPYYGAPVTRALQAQHTAQVEKCVALLETLADRMDEECLERERLAALARERLQQQEDRRHQQAIDAWLAAQQQQPQKATTAATDQSAVRQSALDKLKLLQPGGPAEIATGVPVPPPPARQRSSTRYGWPSDDSDDAADEDHYCASQQQPHGAPLPPPLLPPAPPSEWRPDREEEDKKEDELSSAAAVVPPPPPYQAVVSHPPKYHSFFGPADDDDDDEATVSAQPPPYQAIRKKQQPAQQQPPKPQPPMRQQQELSRQRYAQFQREGRIRVLPLGTYQGRVSASTNGCTVISALVAARHLSGNNGSGGGCISDQTIQNVIDRQCGPFLKEIRAKLGLGGAALIIPSDVHDHLVDAGVLKQEHFAGAAGGNILDPDHAGEFLKLLTGDRTKRRAAATLFFREHVVSIVKFPANSNNGSNGSPPSPFQYDLIDSLPSPAAGGRATRTRCADAEALEALLQWYASRKFADHHCDYIDRNRWDDGLADLDPRVFQGFVWSA